MASISELQSAYSASRSTATQGKSDLGKEEFLLLLTTQLENQDPMNPMDNTEFVAQLSQFSSLEQLWNINDTMGQGNELALALNNTMMTNLIGKDIQFAGNTLYQSDAGVTSEVGFYLSNSGAIRVDVMDETGQVVRSMNQGVLSSGDHSVQWDGKNDHGDVVANGPYTVQVVYQQDGGQEVPVNPYMVGHVSGVQVANGQPMIFVGDQPLNPALVIAIFERRDS